jgi:hypothetical protein
MTKLRRIPVFNRGPGALDVGLEPEGDYVTLGTGESLEIRYSVEGNVEPSIELEAEGDLLSIHCMIIKEVWQNGQRVR